MSTSDQSLLRAIADDRALGSAMLFSHRHPNDTPDFHVEIMDMWRCADEFVLVEAFREAGKSTLSEEFLLMEGCFGNFGYAIIFGETYAKACQRIEAIAWEAQRNVKLAKLFGKVLAKKPIENKIHLSSGALIEGVGWEQEITGFKHLDRRPDRAYLDDVENLERVRSTEAVDATVRKLYREVLPAMDKARRKIRVTQTPRASDCLVTRLRADPEWLSRSFPVCSGDIDDPSAYSLWPDRYPMDWIKAERNRFQSMGMLKEFMQEYMLSVDSVETKPFSEDMLRWTDIAPAAWLPRYAIYDPARTSDPSKSDRTGKVVVSRMGSRIIVHESAGQFWKPDEVRDDIFTTRKKHHCAEVGIEKNSLDDFLMQPIRFEMLRRGETFPVRALQAPQDRDKDQFIMGLQPFFKAGDVMLVGGRGNHPQLVAEILNFPGGRKDILNALAYSLRMFAGMPVYEDFGEANIGPAPEPLPADIIYTGWSASSSEVVCVAMIRSGRYVWITRDWASSGPVTDAVKSIISDLRANYPRNRIECYVPAELHDAWQRIPLVPALRSHHLVPWRGEHAAVARGCLADAMRTTIRERRLLWVSKDATLMLNALAAGYKYPVSTAGRGGHEPEPGLPRLAAEATETMFAALTKSLDNNSDEGVNYATNPQGVKFRTALPQRR